jgi:diguanylate cyclase (GGDEF)-like protein
LSGGQTAILGVAVDVTERKRAEAELAHQALHDPLTGLPNRALFLEHLERSLHRTKRHPEALFAVLFLDLDRFKIVNDSLGHIAGDELLTQAAERLRMSTRQGDTIARLGGDEFAVLLDDLQSVGEAVEVARRILRALKKPLKLGTREFVVTASIGIAPGRRDYAGPKDILRDADIAMYKAKETGRNRCAVFDTAMHRQAVALLDLEADLRGAVERNEFELHYQEIRSLMESDLVGYEALLRWRHPTDGLRVPAQFLRLADETGILTEVGWWALKEACQQVKRWTQTRPSPLSVSVNLDGGQFADPRLTERVASALEENGLAPARLKLEITETAIMESEAMTASRLRDLSSLGVGVEIDDFGTGYSSLSRLLHLPITAVKIDRTFIESLKRGDDAVEIVRSIVRLAHSLKLNVVAEGIETAEQLARLREAGCDYGQGFYFSRPLSFRD